MQSLKSFARGEGNPSPQNPSQQAPSPQGVSSSKEWAQKRVRFTNRTTTQYIRPSEGSPQPQLRLTVATAQPAPIMSAPPSKDYTCWGCGGTHRLPHSPFLAHVCCACKKAGNLDAVCWKTLHHQAPSSFAEKATAGCWFPGPCGAQEAHHVEGLCSRRCC